MPNGLFFWNHQSGGIRRIPQGKGFSYRTRSGKPVSAQIRSRIERLAIPPAWTDVVICPSSHGHIQAVGLDARRRRQYRYHDSYRASQETSKFNGLRSFGAALPRLRAHINAEIARPGMGREKLLATMVRLLDETLIRVGGSNYARENQTYGLSTLRAAHARDDGRSITLSFKGKSGRAWRSSITDRRLTKIIRACQALPGQDLFQYIDDSGVVRRIQSTDINRYLREISGKRITAKDFRTWAGSALCLELLGSDPGERATERSKKAQVRDAVKKVAEALGNTAAVCRASYIHPAIITNFMAGSLPAISQGDDCDLSPGERALLKLLRAQPRRNRASTVQVGSRLRQQSSLSGAAAI